MSFKTALTAAALAVLLNSNAPFSASAESSVELCDVPPVDMAAEEMLTLSSTKENMSFQTEVARMLDIIINSLYTQRDVFLRELVSNAADALEKARYLSLNDNSVLGNVPDLSVKITFNRDAKQLIITDTGVGMSRQELISNLGTLAKSGTTNFLEAMAGGSDLSLIGQFGVGFYSSFLVADRVTVISRKINDDQYIWESSADAHFTVAKDPRGNLLPRGTQVVLHLKEDATEYLNDKKLNELLNKYSQFISFPIYLQTSQESTREVPDDSGVLPEPDENGNIPDMPTKTITETTESLKHVNNQKAIWLRSKEDVTEEEYENFYRILSKEPKPPMAYTHFKAEGDVDFRSILFIPATAQRDVYDNIMGKSAKIKLFARRVLVSDGLEDILPKYLHFLHGVVDSDDLPLNVSREQLQQNRVMKLISRHLVKRTFDLLSKLSKEDIDEQKRALDEYKNKEKDESDEITTPVTKYNQFYKEHGRALKMGCFEDDSNREKIIKLLRFKSLKHSRKPKGLSGDFHGISLEEYIGEMKEDQNEIYFIAGESIPQLNRMPYLQAYKKRGLDVLYLTEPLDEPCLQKAIELSGKRFVNIQKGDTKFKDSDEEVERHKKLVKYFLPLTNWWKKALSDKDISIGRVEVSKRLVEDPVAIVASEYGYSAQMEKVFKAQAFTDPSQLKHLASMRTLEINPDHPTIQKMLEVIASKTKSNEEIPEELKETARVLYDAALLSSGFDLDAPTTVSNAIYKLISKDLGVFDMSVAPVSASVLIDEFAEADIKTNGDDNFNFDDLNFDDNYDIPKSMHDEL